jgi:hypothetical protein
MVLGSDHGVRLEHGYLTFQKGQGSMRAQAEPSETGQKHGYRVPYSSTSGPQMHGFRRRMGHTWRQEAKS